MCKDIIVDTNSFPVLTDGKARDEILFQWIDDGRAKLCVAPNGKMFEEVRRNTKFLRLTDVWRRTGKTIIPNEGKLQQARQHLVEYQKQDSIESNDSHVLEIMIASGASILVSDDRFLGRDVKKMGKVSGQRQYIYPLGKPDKKRREFLQRHQCPARTPS